MYKILILLAALISLAALPAAAQKPDIKGGAVVTSEPGRAAAVRAIEISAQVVSINKGSRALSLKGPEGNVDTFKVGDNVKLDKIKAGDDIVARFTEAVAISVRSPSKGKDAAPKK